MLQSLCQRPQSRSCSQSLVSPPQSGLSHDVSESASWNVVGQATWYRHASWLRAMMKLPMTSSLPTQRPAVILKHLDDFSHLHDLATVARIVDLAPRSRSFARAYTLVDVQWSSVCGF